MMIWRGLRDHSFNWIMGPSMKENGSRGKMSEMGEAFKFGQMDQGMKGIGGITELAEEAG